MAKNRIQIKRTSVSGRTANVTNVTNSQYIAAGELALNMPDGILYSSNGSDLITIGANLINQRIADTLTIDNSGRLNFTTVNTSVYSYFTQQNDDNFVFYSTNTAYGARPIWGVYANSVTSNLQVYIPLQLNSGVVANGSIGSPGQILSSNGSATYWATVSGTGTVTQVNTGNGLAGGPITGAGTISVNANDGIVANSSGLYVKAGDNIVVNSSGVHAAAGVNTDAQYTFANTISFTQTINGTANNSLYLNSKTEGNLNVNSALVSNNTNFVGTVSATNVVSNAQLSGNLANYQTTAGLAANVAVLAANSATYLGGNTASDLRTYSDQKADNAYSNAVSYVDGKSYVNTSQLSTNLANYALLSGASFSGNVTANNANTLYNLNVGGNLTVEGNLTVTGNVTTIGANNLSIVDNFIYLNSNNTTQNEDIGIAGNYNDGTYAHTGIFRDATDGYWKVFDGYTPEPDSSVNIDTSNNTFNIAGFWANNIRLGNTTVYSTANSTVFSGTANNATYLNGQLAAYYTNATNITTGTLPYAQIPANVINTTANFTITGVTTFNANVILGAGLSANGGFGTAGQVLTSNGTATYWSSAGVNVDATYAWTNNHTWSAAANLAVGTTIQTDTRFYVNTYWSSDSSTYNLYVNSYDQNTSLTAIRNRYGVYSSLNNRSQNKNVDGVTTYNSNYRAVVGDVVSGSSSSGGNAFASEIIGGNFRSYNYANGSGANGVNAALGTRNQVFSFGSGTILNAYGTQSQVLIGNSTATGNITTAYGVSSEVISNTSATIGTGYLFYGSHAGANTTNKWGLHISGEDKNYLSGQLGIGTVSPVASRAITLNSTSNYFGIDFQTSGTTVGKIIQESTGNMYYDSLSALVFRSNTNIEAMRISSNGNVGVGTSTPSDKFQIAHTGSVDFSARVDSATAGDRPSFRFIHTGGNLTTQSPASSRLGLVSFLGVNDSSALTTYSFFDSFLDGTANSTANSYIRFQTTALGTSAERLRIGAGAVTLSANLILGTSGLSANGGFGTAGHVLHSNGSATYWAADDNSGGTVTSITIGTGLSSTQSPLTTSGTLSVNATYIGTLSANNTTYVNGKTEGNLNVNSATTATNSTQLGSVAAASYARKDIAETFAANVTASSYFTGNWFRSTGASGWYNQTYGGGVWMDNSTQVKVYGSKQLWSGPFAGTTAVSTDTSQIQVQNGGGSGDNDVACISFHCSGTYGSKMHLRSDGYFGIGGWSAAAWRWYVNLGNGDMTAAGNVTAYSDIRLKENITPLTNSLYKIKKLNGVRFTWKNLPDVVGSPGKPDFGILAHEVEAVAPELISESSHKSPDGDPYKTVAYDKLVPLLIEAVKELSNQVDELKKKLGE